MRNGRNCGNLSLCFKVKVEVSDGDAVCTFVIFDSYMCYIMEKSCAHFAGKSKVPNGVQPPVPGISKLVWWLQFLKHCPKLQNVTIEDCDAGDQSDVFDKYLKDEPIVPPCLSSQLKTFCLRGYMLH
ncbi:hypothetical protein P8452_24659 [Trifolium repens]|nr:hypothetical protein P8452_24659 [Trifolium repens]